MRNVLTMFTALLMLTSCVVAHDPGGEMARPVELATDSAKVETEATKLPEEPKMITTESGLRYQNLVVGEGKEATDKMNVECHYAVWLADSTGLEKDKLIQSSKDSGKSFRCTIGTGLVAGWSEGMTGMKEGGTRRLFVPWKLGYGASGHASGIIPGKTNLIFEIDFLSAVEK